MGVKVRYLKLMRWAVAGSLTFATAGLVVMASDRLVGNLLDRYKPELERKFAKQIGRPLLIGEYKGLSPWGVSFGYTQLLSGFNDQSFANIEGLKIQFAPIASLINRRPVAILSLRAAEIHLERNINGTYWLLGESEEQKTPDIDLRLRLIDSSKAFIKPANIELTATGNAFINFAENKVGGKIRLGFPNKGLLFLSGNGYLNNLEFQAKARLKNFGLDSSQGILPLNSTLKPEGYVDGDFDVGVHQGQVNCKGGIAISNLRLGVGGLSSEKVSIECSDDLVKLPSSQWKYGQWTANIRGEAPLNDSQILNLRVLSSVGLENNSEDVLNIDAQLPFLVKKRGFVPGDLLADFQLSSLPLNQLGILIDTPISGILSAKGVVKGPIGGIEVNSSLELDNPQFGSVRFQEQWRGEFSGTEGGGGEFNLNSVGAAVPGSLRARIDKKWGLKDLLFKRLSGEISVERTPSQYKWFADSFRVDRIEVAIPPEKSFKRIFGQLSGEGSFDMNPIFFSGDLKWGYPRLIGVKLKEAQLKGSYYDKNYSFEGGLLPPNGGQILLNSEGIIGGRISTKARFKKVNPSWLIESVSQFPKINVESPLATGNAEGLKNLSIQPKKGSLDSQLRDWALSVISLTRNKELQRKRKVFNSDDLRGYVNGVIEIEGSDLSNVVMDLKTSGKLWTKGESQRNIKPFIATFKGPLNVGSGDFSLMNIPFSLLSLFFPSPSGLSGMFGLSGKYRLGKKNSEITADLILKDAKLLGESIVLERGKLLLSGSILNMDLSLRNFASSQPVTLVGKLPLNSSSDIDLRMESHGDGLRFLGGLSDGALSWKSGSADLRLLLRGKLEDPKANGFLVLENNELIVKERIVKNLNGTIVFDFNRLEVQNLEGRLGLKSIVSASGAIPLFKAEKKEKEPLSIDINRFKFKSSFSDVETSSSLKIRGSTLQPRIGGEVIVKEGFLSASQSKDEKKVSAETGSNRRLVSNKNKIRLPEQNWNREDPLLLFIQDNTAPANKLFRDGIPQGFERISFDNLRVVLGPRLRVVSQPLASFEAEGAIFLNGSLDENLNASGLVRLLNGRVNLFTTTFKLDRRETNVAVFVPSMGLMPYVDLKMTSRVPDTVRDPSELTSSSDFMTNGSGSFGIGGSRFVKVEVTASGPADRLKENFKLRSTPPLPEKQLLGLIGGNSLTNLLSGGDNTVFADVLNRSFLSPVLGNINGAFEERLQISFYPAYVNRPELDEEGLDSESSEINTTSTNLAPQQAWVTEVGLDLTDRINFAVQSTPNRDDIPSQGTISFQLNSNLGVKGSFDQKGNWQSQLQLFLRY